MRIIDSLRRRVVERPRRGVGSPDLLGSLSPRDWADLPTWHPGNDTPAR